MKNISKLQIKDTIILFFTDNVNLWRTFSKYKVLTDLELIEKE